HIKWGVGIDLDGLKWEALVTLGGINHTDRKMVEMAAYLNAVDDADDAASESDADSSDDCDFADYDGDV
ncbi:hypothetical protein AaE_012374, partial [Aphanomyces astaci]